MLVRLFDPVMQFQNKGGALNTAGRLEVYLEGTDDLAKIYSDEEGRVPLSQPAILDNNGRSRGLYVESGVKYRLAVRTNHGALLFTVRNMVPVGGGGGGGQSLSASLPLKIEGGTITNNGTGITCTGENAWAEGHNTTASGEHSHAEGSETIASGANTHAEGAATKATHPHAHAEGFHTEATATSAHAEGSGAKATTTTAHAEGQDTVASGDASHAQGRNSVASGAYSHASGYGTRATGQGSHAVGKYNDDGSALFVVGDGTDNNHRKDVFKVDSNGDTWVMIGGVLTKVTNVSGGGGSSEQFVLVRSDMTTNFTNAEYKDCVDAVTAEQAVCVQFVRTGTTIQAQLTQITGSGKLVFEVDSEEYHYVFEVSEVSNAHSINEIVKHIGTRIFKSLQDAISEEITLSIGDIFETNGFHTSGDGGASRYMVSSTGTANGMDIIQLAAGKLAVLQIDDGTATPEQFGYNRWNQDDLTPIMNRMQTAHVRNIILSPLESGDNFPYLMKTTFTPNPSVRISSHFDFNTGASGRIWFLPSTYGADHTIMFQLTNRGFGIKDVVLMNRPWFSEGDKHNCVCFRMAISGTNNMWYEFESLAIQGFDIGILHENVTGQDSSGLIWHCTFKKLQMALNNINVYLKNVNYLTKFENCFFTCNDSGARSIVLEETFSTEFERCNFGIYNPATTVVDFKDYIVTGKAVDRRFSQAKFTSCNFEIESDGSHPLPTSNKGFFMRFGDHDEFNVELDNCYFIVTPLARSNIYGCRAIQLGSNTKMKITNTSGPYADVKYTGEEFYEWDFCKRMFDESKPPRKEIGSIIIEHCVGIIPPPNNAWGSVYLPVVKTDDMTCPQSDDNTDFLANYPDARDGVLLLNLDKANIETKVGNSIVQVTAPASGKIRIGDRIYDYVTIDGRKWITENLQLWTMNTRQWHFPSHDEFGFYYGPETWTEIDALLPAGWRRPNYNDCQSLISQGYAALEATGYSQWTGATNTTGFSGLPCGRWRKPNVTPDFNRGFIWGPEEVGVGYHAIHLQASGVSYAGWPYAEVTSTNDPIRCVMRVCCDA